MRALSPETLRTISFGGLGALADEMTGLRWSGEVLQGLYSRRIGKRHTIEIEAESVYRSIFRFQLRMRSVSRALGLPKPTAETALRSRGWRARYTGGHFRQAMAWANARSGWPAREVAGTGRNFACAVPIFLASTFHRIAGSTFGCIRERRFHVSRNAVCTRAGEAEDHGDKASNPGSVL